MYSFAVSLYQILTSILPTNGQDIRQVIMNILNEIPIPINKINSNLPESLAHILSKAMEKDKEKRYANMEEFEAALREISEYKNQLDQKFGTNDTTIEKTSKLKKKRVDVFSKVDLSWIDNI
ncbi:MAG: hypothetical protein H7263_10975 [Candidatus Sericytochromatia bacterium]|nr:hypothetical protein [Candidatus Sericytochromatia bacterium]